ncbi:MAG: FdtA/QdtA family cupin domain-containing protein [Myxococcaceae bacterium]
MSIDACQVISLPKISDPRGNLTFIEANQHIPFPIERVYYLYDVPTGAGRAGHAHKALRQLLIAASGSFDVHLDDGTRKKTVHLNKASEGLIIDSLVWREIDNFSGGAVCLVLASMRYLESDYYRRYEDFLAAARAS